jgi:two-component system OmpR family sensor kinase
MIRTLRLRLVAVVAVFIALVGIATVVGLRIVVDVNAERQAYLAGVSVASWGTSADGVRVIDSERLRELSPVATVVVLLDAGDDIVAVSSDATIPLADVTSLVAATAAGATTHQSLNGRSMTFTRVTFDEGTVYRDGSDVPLSGALVGIATEGAERLVRALLIAEVIVLGALLVTASVIVTVVVSRTTRTLTALAERVEDNDMTGVRAVAAGFSETDELADALVRLDEKRARSEQELRDFVADTSHELKTPLTKIQGWSELHFQDPDDRERTERALSSIVEESHRMRRLVDQLALLARAEALPTQARTPVDLSALAESFLADVSVGSDTVVTSRVEPGVMVLGDEFSLLQVLRNLVGNALVHAGDGATIELSLKATGNDAVLRVDDDGVGIRADRLAGVFDRFATGNRDSGSGLGLAIVRGIVTAHGGSIDFISAEDAGTHVEARLPLLR